MLSADYFFTSCGAASTLKLPPHMPQLLLVSPLWEVLY
jgi:hypothetical protein